MRIEQQIQIAIVQDIRYRYPNVLFTISPAGMINNPRIGAITKKMGYRAGTSDMLFFEPRGIWHGLMIELKIPAALGTSKVSPEQKKWQIDALERGYKAVICYGHDETMLVLKEYLAEKTDKSECTL